MFNDWKLDQDSVEPAYKQLAYYLGRLIKNGHLVNGTKLPSQRDLCRIFNVSRPTVFKALEQLEYENLIVLEERKKAIVRIDIRSRAYSKVNWDDYTNVTRFFDDSNNSIHAKYLRGEPNIINLFEACYGADFEPWKPIEAVMPFVERELHNIHHHSYFDIRGVLSLRQTICNHLSHEGIYVNPSQVLICNNLQNAHMILLRALGNKNINCYMEEESIYLNDEDMKRLANFIPVKIDENGIVPESLIDKLKTKNRGILLVDTEFAMPTGIVHSLARKKELIRISSEWKLPIIENPAVRDCWHEFPPEPSLKSMDVCQNVVYVFSLARPYMPVMLTALIVPDALMPALMDIRLLEDGFTDSMSQMILEKLLCTGTYADYMNTIRPKVIERRDLVDAMLHKYFDGIAQWELPHAGVNFRLNFNFSIRTCFDSLADEGILLYSPELFGSNKNYIWFCYTGVSLDKLDYALCRVAYHVRNAKEIFKS